MPSNTQNNNLTDFQKQVLFNKATEPPFTGDLLNNKKSGMYVCANCGTNLFDSNTKFDSGSGWPSFFDAVDKNAVKLVKDDSHGMHRTEVVCSNCGGHLGHLFDDAPTTPTGQRYCINSCSLDFSENNKKEK